MQKEFISKNCMHQLVYKAIAILIYKFDMEEKKAEISAYLRTTVSPFITPLMEELVKKRPGDLLAYTKLYVEKLISI